MDVAGAASALWGLGANLVGRGVAHVHHLHDEADGLAGEGVVAVHGELAVGDVGDDEVVHVALLVLHLHLGVV